jgi:hypothetical protein
MRGIIAHTHANESSSSYREVTGYRRETSPDKSATNQRRIMYNSVGEAADPACEVPARRSDSSIKGLRTNPLLNLPEDRLRMTSMLKPPGLHTETYKIKFILYFL